jgi:prevent-host-death family protein
MQLPNPHSATHKGTGTSFMEKIIGAYEARRRFGQLIEEAFYKKDSFIIERAGRPMAVLVPIEDYHKWQQLARDQVFRMVEQVWERTKEVPPEELEQDIAQALKTLQEQPHQR